MRETVLEVAYPPNVGNGGFSPSSLCEFVKLIEMRMEKKKKKKIERDGTAPCGIEWEWNRCVRRGQSKSIHRLRADASQWESLYTHFKNPFDWCFVVYFVNIYRYTGTMPALVVHTQDVAPLLLFSHYYIRIFIRYLLRRSLWLDSFTAYLCFLNENLDFVTFTIHNSINRVMARRTNSSNKLEIRICFCLIVAAFSIWSAWCDSHQYRWNDWAIRFNFYLQFTHTLCIWIKCIFIPWLSSAMYAQLSSAQSSAQLSTSEQQFMIEVKRL